jgi:arylsulfatase A-like enzyme
MNAIVFVLRGCSASWLGAYGNEWIATPNLDRIAAEGVVFDRHISDCPDPVAACKAWLAASSQGDELPRPTLLDSLRDRGVTTILVRANHPETDAPDWFYAHWSEVFDARPQEEDRYRLDSLIRSLPSLLDRLSGVTQFLMWFEIDSLLPPWDVRQDVFEAYVQDAEDEADYRDDDEGEDEDDDPDEVDATDIDEDEDVEEQELLGDEASDESPAPHEPDTEQLDEDPVEEQKPVTPWYDPPTGLFDRSDAVAREWLLCSLAAVATGMDAELGLVFEQLRARGLDRSAGWVVTSDFGYPLGEHGQIGRHRPWLYEELVHLPLLLKLPGGEEACRRVDAMTQPQDVASTLAELLGISLSQVHAGMSLLPFARGAATSAREFAITTLDLGMAAERSIRTAEWAFLLPGKLPEGETREPQLYSKPDDRWEVNDQRPRNVERADEIEERLRAAFGEKKGE